jgi:hypothetical protein
MNTYVVKVRQVGAKSYHSTILCHEGKTQARQIVNDLSYGDTEANIFVRVPSDKGFAYLTLEAAEDLAHTFAVPVQTTPVYYPDTMRELFTALRHGRLIEAIKQYRAITGEGLRESKDAIESFMPHLSKIA